MIIISFFITEYTDSFTLATHFTLCSFFLFVGNDYHRRDNSTLLGSMNSHQFEKISNSRNRVIDY